MKEHLIKNLQMYKTEHDDEKKMVKRILDFLVENRDCFGKENLGGHITGSAWIVNHDRTKVLLTHHYKLNIWIQLGGHTEVNETVLESAYREGIEESGLMHLMLLQPDIYDVDVHDIPARGGISHHSHYDIRYLFEGDDALNLNISDESHDLAWVDINNISNYSQERSVLRMVEKMRDI